MANMNEQSKRICFLRWRTVLSSLFSIADSTTTKQQQSNKNSLWSTNPLMEPFLYFTFCVLPSHADFLLLLLLLSGRLCFIYNNINLYKHVHYILLLMCLSWLICITAHPIRLKPIKYNVYIIYINGRDLSVPTPTDPELISADPDRTPTFVGCSDDSGHRGVSDGRRNRTILSNLPISEVRKKLFVKYLRFKWIYCFVRSYRLDLYTVSSHMYFLASANFIAFWFWAHLL